jgi:hypothetical protein
MGGMARWIVAGILLVVLVGLIVGDELGLFGSTPTVATSPGPDAVTTGQENEGAEPEVVPEETDLQAREDVLDTCKPVIAVLEQAGGVEYWMAVGDVLYEQKGYTPERVREICKELEGASADEVVARMQAESGLAPSN